MYFTINQTLKIYLFSNQKQLLGALAAAAKGGRIIGWEEARLYARLSVNFVSIFIELIEIK